MKKINIKTICLSAFSILALNAGNAFAGDMSVVVSPDNSSTSISANKTDSPDITKQDNDDITKDKISDSAVEKIVNEESSVNPYAGTPLEAEDYSQKSKILDSEISFYTKKIELQKKKDDFDLSPLKRKLAETNLNSQLMEADGYSPSQGKDSREPQISDEEINRRIKYGIDKAIQQEKQSIVVKQAELKKQTIRKESQFNLKMISNQKDKTSAIVENNDKTYVVKAGDKIGKWDVVNISSDEEFVTIKNGKITRKITYSDRNPVINITKIESKTDNQTQQVENTVDQGLPVPPNFNN